MELTHFLIRDVKIVERKSVKVTTFSPEMLAATTRILPLLRERDAEKRRLSKAEHKRVLAKASNSGIGSTLPMPGELVTEYPEEVLQERERLQFNAQPELFEEDNSAISLGLSPTRKAILDCRGQQLLLLSLVRRKTAPREYRITRDNECRPLYRAGNHDPTQAGDLATIGPTERHTKQAEIKPLASEIVTRSPALVSLFLTDPVEITVETQAQMFAFAQGLALAILS